MFFDPLNLISIISFIVGIISLIIALTQTIRLSHLKKIRVDSLRSALQNCRLTMLESDRLLNKRNEYGIESKGALIKIEAIHANSCGLLRSLFYELSQVDTPYDEQKLKQYISLDLITSTWLWKQAALFIPGQSFPSNIPELPNDTPDYMAKAGGFQNESETDDMLLR